jgi:hypothetical protein
MDQQMLMEADVVAAELLRCIEDCERCHRACLRAMSYCLEQGGRHAELPHFRLLLASANVCRMTADAMLAGFPFYEHLCAVCARMCRDCAQSCCDFDDLQDCGDACRTCVHSCTQIAHTAAQTAATQSTRHLESLDADAPRVTG